jgi:hypothetical protein
MPKLYLKDGRTYQITEAQSLKLAIITFLKPWNSPIGLRGAGSFTIRDIVTDPEEIGHRNQASLFDIPSITIPKKNKRKTGELA